MMIRPNHLSIQNRQLERILRIPVDYLDARIHFLSSNQYLDVSEWSSKVLHLTIVNKTKNLVCLAMKLLKFQALRVEPV